MTPTAPESPAPPRFLVTAGGTREAIDRVRDWGNVFSGNTGHAIAVALADLGPVTLVTSNKDHVAALAATQPGRHPIATVPFRSYDDLRAALDGLMSPTPPAGTPGPFSGVFMTAAVSDYAPAGAFQVIDRRPGPDGDEVWVVRPAQAGKVKSTFEQMAVLGRRTEKLVDLFRGRWGYRGLLVKFKLEVGIGHDALIAIGRASRRASGADHLVANTLDMTSGPGAGAYLLSDAGDRWVPRAELAAALREVAEGWRAAPAPRA